MYTSDAIHELIRHIYLAGVDASRWPAFLELFTRTIDSPSGFLSFIDTRHGGASTNLSVGLSNETLRLYRERYAAIDPFAHGTAALGPLRPGFIGLSQDLISEQELERTPFYIEFGRQHGFLGGIICVLYAGENSLSSVLGANRRPGRFFGEPEVELLRILLPHFRTALQIQRELELKSQAGRAALGTLDHLRVAAFVCGESGEVVYQNRAAASLSYVDEHAQFQGPNRLDTKKIQAAVSEVCAGRHREVGIALSGADGRIAVVAPIRVQAVLPLTRPLAVILIPVEQDLTAAGLEEFRRLHGLTLAETRMVIHLLRGRTPKEAAAALGVTYETARTYLKRALEKTHCRRQSELVRKVLTSLPSA